MKIGLPVEGRSHIGKEEVVGDWVGKRRLRDQIGAMVWLKEVLMVGSGYVGIVENEARQFWVLLDVLGL
jgi:hypothetical protein